jgi:hypothetical protein
LSTRLNITYVKLSKNIQVSISHTQLHNFRNLLHTCRLILLRIGYRCSQRVEGFHGRLSQDYNFWIIPGQESPLMYWLRNIRVGLQISVGRWNEGRHRIFCTLRDEFGTVLTDIYVRGKVLTNGPYINRGPILGVAHQEFRSPVPPGSHVVCIVFSGA